MENQIKDYKNNSQFTKSLNRQNKHKMFQGRTETRETSALNPDHPTMISSTVVSASQVI